MKTQEHPGAPVGGGAEPGVLEAGPTPLTRTRHVTAELRRRVISALEDFVLTDECQATSRAKSAMLDAMKQVDRVPGWGTLPS